MTYFGSFRSLAIKSWKLGKERGYGCSREGKEDRRKVYRACKFEDSLRSNAKDQISNSLTLASIDCGYLVQSFALEYIDPYSGWNYPVIEQSSEIDMGIEIANGFSSQIGKPVGKAIRRSTPA